MLFTQPGETLPYPSSLERMSCGLGKTCIAAFELTNYRAYNYTNRQDNVKCQSLMTDVLIPRLTAISPDSGAYLNEADWKQPNWQSTFYGSHYPALEEIKQKFDPDHMFYARTAVGSEAWVEQSDGRLCQV
jgi:hypothetical protein